jgi:hypothetical protein
MTTVRLRIAEIVEGSLRTMPIRRNPVTDEHFPAMAELRRAIWAGLRLQAGMAHPGGYRLTTDRRLTAYSGALPVRRAAPPESLAEVELVPVIPLTDAPSVPSNRTNPSWLIGV